VPSHFPARSGSLNFEVFTPCDFIAAITQHIPDKSFQLVRYYGWYSNKMRGQRDKQAAEEARAAGKAVEVINVSDQQPRRIPSAKWRERQGSTATVSRRRSSLLLELVFLPQRRRGAEAVLQDHSRSG